MPEDLEDMLNELMMEALRLDGTTVAVFRRVCASLNYLADRQELQGLAAPARPFEEPIVCAAAACCPVVYGADDEELASDTFDPAEFEPVLKEEMEL